MFTAAEIWNDRQQILELVKIRGKVKNHREIYQLFVKTKEANPFFGVRYDVREYVRFSADEGLVHDDVEALLSLGYLNGYASLTLTKLGKDFLNKAKPSDSIEFFKKLKKESFNF